MPRLQSLAPLLRPLAAPRAATAPCRRLPFSSAARLRLEQQPPFSKAKTLKNTSREKKASASASPDTTTTTTDTPMTTFHPATHIELPPPSYHISRTTAKNLPIYTEYKRGGNLHLTTIRKITGDLSALRDELRVFLNKKNEDVKINALTGHVIVKGHCTAQVKEFLEARGM